MSKLQQILKDGKFVLQGIEYSVDHAGTNNDPANNIQDGDIQRLYGIGENGVSVKAPLFAVESVNYIPGEHDDVEVPPPTDTGTETKFDEDGIMEVEFEDEQGTNEHTVDGEPIESENPGSEPKFDEEWISEVEFEDEQGSEEHPVDGEPIESKNTVQSDTPVDNQDITPEPVQASPKRRSHKGK